MCRNCSLPDWGEPVKLPVKELPPFFAKQISWNFERLNFGVGAIVETESGKSERPSVTGRIGCRLKENIQPSARGKRSERYLLVSECLYCPGKRYGCTPRTNCTGKRRNCYAMCKVSVYGDAPEIAEISFAGSHGRGNVTDPTRHRTPSEPKRRRGDLGADSNDSLQRWKPLLRPTMVESLSSDELKYDGSSTGTVSLDVGHSSAVSCGEIELVSTDLVAPRSSRSPVVLWSASAAGEQDGPVQTGNNWSNTNGTATSSPATPSTPLNTPLSSSIPASHYSVHNGSIGSQARVPALYTSPRIYTGPKSNLGHHSLTQAWRTESKSVGSRSPAVQAQEKDQEILTLRQHIQILQEEHLSKISRIAGLEAQLHLLKEGELSRLEQQIQRLETGNLKKDVTILQLEKQLQAALFSRSQSPALQVPRHVQPVHDGAMGHSREGRRNNDEISEGDKDEEKVEEVKQAEGKEPDKEDIKDEYDGEEDIEGD